MSLLTGFYGMNVKELTQGATGTLFEFWEIGIPVILVTAISPIPHRGILRTHLYTPRMQPPGYKPIDRQHHHITKHPQLRYPCGIPPAHFRPQGLRQSLQIRPCPDNQSASLAHSVVSSQQLANRRFGLGSECLERLDHVCDYARHERD